MRMISVMPGARGGRDWLVLTCNDNDVSDGPLMLVESAHATAAAAKAALRRRPPAVSSFLPLTRLRPTWSPPSAVANAARSTTPSTAPDPA